MGGGGAGQEAELAVEAELMISSSRGAKVRPSERASDRAGRERERGP